MEKFPRLSNREWEVVKLLLQGKSNKLIASSLGISDRTVEFHLKNIYAKFQVRSRIELILKLGNITGALETEKLGRSTVDGMREIAENGGKLNSRMGWVTSLRDTVSKISKDVEMKRFLNRNKGDLMKPSLTNVLIALGIIVIGVAIAAAGIYIGEIDDAPGAALLGILLMLGSLALGVRTARRKA